MTLYNLLWCLHFNCLFITPWCINCCFWYYIDLILKTLLRHVYKKSSLNQNRRTYEADIPWSTYSTELEEPKLLAQQEQSLEASEDNRDVQCLLMISGAKKMLLQSLPCHSKPMNTDVAIGAFLWGGWVNRTPGGAGLEWKALLCAAVCAVGCGSVSVWIIKLGNYRLGWTQALFSQTASSPVSFFWVQARNAHSHLHTCK